MSKYQVILADPPWQYGAWAKNSGSRTAESFYRTMPTKKICEMAPMVDELADDNCALFLWGTPPMLDDAREVLEAWGFRYVTWAFVWVKMVKDGSRPKMGMGHYTRGNAEPCLLGLRGRMPVADKGVHQIIMAPLREHSRKPDDQYHRINRLYPESKKIEMFARSRNEGFDVWGNEVDKFDIGGSK